MAEWQSGHAADCKSVNAGSIPTSASKIIMKNKISTAVIPVAGRGTRMLPATKAIPKEMLPILNKPIIQMVIEEVLSAGIRNIVFITRSGKEAMKIILILILNWKESWRKREKQCFLSL